MLVLILSMLPFLELRGAIPYSFVTNIDLKYAILIAIIGNVIPIPFIYMFAHKILVFGKDKKYIGKIFTTILDKGHRIGEKLKKKTGIGIYIALMLFVGVPIPGSGVWTGTLAASILELEIKKTIFFEFLGVIISAIIVTLISLGVIVII